LNHRVRIYIKAPIALPNLCPTSAKSQFKAKFEANLGAKQQQ